MKQFYSLALAAFICVLCSFGARTQAENGTDNILYQSVGHGTPYPHESWNQYTNIAGAPNVEVIVYNDNSIRVNGWAGVGGYDFILTHDDSDLKSITSLHDGVAEDIDPDKFIIKTGTGDGRDFYISPGYCKIYVDANKGAIFLQGFLFGDGNPEQYVYYYIEWPLTADELTLKIEAAHKADSDQINEWISTINSIREDYPEFAASQDGVEIIEPISEEVMDYSSDVDSAYAVAYKHWGYKSPLNEEIIEDINDSLDFAMEVAQGFDGIESITIDVNGENNFFDIYGRPVDNPVAGSIVIKVANGVASKVFVK